MVFMALSDDLRPTDRCRAVRPRAAPGHPPSRSRPAALVRLRSATSDWHAELSTEYGNAPRIPSVPYPRRASLCETAVVQSWLISILRTKLVTRTAGNLLLGPQLERDIATALGSARETAIRSLIYEGRVDESDLDGALQMLLSDETFPPNPVEGMAIRSLAEDIHAEIGQRVAVLADPNLTGHGVSALAILGLSSDLVANVVTTAIVNAFRWHALTPQSTLGPIADQLNHDLTRVVLREREEPRSKTLPRSEDWDSELIHRLGASPSGRELLADIREFLIPALENVAVVSGGHPFVGRSHLLALQTIDWLIPDAVAEFLGPFELAVLLTAVAALGRLTSAAEAGGPPYPIEHARVALANAATRLSGSLHSSTSTALDEAQRLLEYATLPFSEVAEAVRPRFLANGAPLHSDLLYAYTTLLVPILKLATDLGFSGTSAPAELLEIGATPTALKIRVRCRSDQYHDRLLTMVDDLRSALLGYHIYLPEPYVALRGEVIPSAMPYHHVDETIETVGYRPWPVKFDVDPRSALRLLAELYRSVAVPIRELIQNAIDACHLRAILVGHGERYLPSITVLWQTTTRRLIVRDNGIGIPSRLIETTFGTVGGPYRIPVHLDAAAAAAFRPIGHFGIGLLSAFMISDGVKIRTRHGSEPGLEMAIPRITSYFRITDWAGSRSGTEVELSLRPSIKLDVTNTIKHYARNVDIPIEIVVDGQHDILLERHELSIDWQAIAYEDHKRSKNTRLAVPWPPPDTPDVFESARRFGGYEVRLALVLSPLRSTSRNDMFPVPAPHQRVVVLNRGVLVFQSATWGLGYEVEGSSSNTYFYGGGVYAVINLMRHVAELGPTRDALRETAWTQRLKERLRSVLVDALEQACLAAGKRAGVTLLKRRQYVFQLLILTTGSGTIDNSMDSRDATGSRRGEHQTVFSVDGAFAAAVADVYAAHYPIAWKHGPYAEFATLKERIKRLGRSHLGFVLADPRYPNFYGWGRLEADGISTGVLDSPREYGLICEYVNRYQDGAVRCTLFSGWDLWRLAGTRDRGQQLGRLPARAVLGESVLLRDEVVLAIMDCKLHHEFAAAGRYGYAGGDATPIYIQNSRHCVSQWLMRRLWRDPGNRLSQLWSSAIALVVKEDSAFFGTPYSRIRSLCYFVDCAQACDDFPTMTTSELVRAIDPLVWSRQYDSWPLVDSTGEVRPGSSMFGGSQAQTAWWAQGGECVRSEY
jgi:hypothetical protein